MKYYEHSLYQEELKKLSDNVSMRTVLSGKTIAITGARGLIGSELIDAIMYANIDSGLQCTIYAIVRNEAAARKRFSSYLQSQYFHLILADVNMDLIRIDGHVDYFIHAASNTHPLDYSSKPIETILTNTVGTNNTLQFAVEHCCHCYVFLSSVEIYGENRGDVDQFTENYCGYLNSNTLRAGYSEGKRSGESLCQAYRKEKKLKCIIPRLARCYGPGLLQEDSKALSQFIRNAITGENIVLKSEGCQLFSYVYAADVCDAIFTLLEKGEDGEAYNITGRDSDIALADLAGMIARLAGKKVIHGTPNKEESQGYSKALKAIMCGDKMAGMNWKAQYTLEKGIKRTITILRESR